MSAVALSFSPLRLDSRSLPVKIAAVLLGTLALAISSRIEVPMFPVPMTMQTFAVTIIGALYGWRLGALTVLAWLGQAAMGMPVLAGGGGGLAPFMGPTAGYLAAFPFAAALTGWLAQMGWNGNRPVLAGLSMLLGNILCLVIGGAVLASMIGVEKAFYAGVAPFIVGAVLKSVLAAAALGIAAPKTAAK
ncbi:MAG: biotin transporter BioY [Paracoccus denitrificans]|nr:MAG: biotin transporter BioY [Paracoccus denitrificans]PZO83577.1 MAG: biotin transporter BioY [Paracoccus denitrificans]